MQKISNSILLSATDLSIFIGCGHATWLDLKLAEGKLKVPPSYPDPSLEALKAKGQQFEIDHIHKLKNEGKRIAFISRGDRRAALAETLQAMKEGVDVVYQARLEHEVWNGWADFLIRVNKPSIWGDWSYEVEDTKFARHTKSGSILQISLYSYILTTLQGVQPEFMHITTPIGKESYRVDDYIAYFRLIQKKLMAAVLQTEESTYPHPVLQCEICKWWILCNKRRRGDDHLSFVAGMGAKQIREVNNWNIQTLKSMAELPLPIAFEPSRGDLHTYTKLREQARVQFQARQENKNIYELLALQPGFGLFQLPEPSEGDLFFDFEGDPFIGTAGREYLFGWVYQNKYYSLWATTDKEEKEAFESFIDTVTEIWKQYPNMHIYHFSAYEPSALKKLMGKYATRADELDRLLRGKIFVDLHLITRYTIRAGVESYSLKEMERFHRFQRIRDLKLVGQQKALLENLLETDNFDAVGEETKLVVQDYNQDDCLSTESLRNWLEDLREELVKSGHPIDRPQIAEADTGPSTTAHQLRIQPIFDLLLKDIPFERKDRNREQQAKWLLAHMLDWYRREMKTFWWDYFRLRDLTDEDLLDEKNALSQLVYTHRSEQVKKSIVHYYTFPEQEIELKTGIEVDYTGASVGTICYLDLKTLTVGIKKNKKSVDIHPTHIICSDVIDQEIKEEAIIRLAKWIVDNGIDAEGHYRAGRDLLLNNLPRTVDTVNQTLDSQIKAVEWVSRLNYGVLPIQGPPGTGKSHTAARMIVSLIREGKKVGVTALSHKVIIGLIEKVIDAASENNVEIRVIQKVHGTAFNRAANWIETTKNHEVLNHLRNGFNIVAGTSFMWSRPDFFEVVDVLFVDEAGQLSLIDTLALSHAAKNLVLLGDPQQLQQPQKGSHPEGTEVSALSHILDGQKTISEQKGVFLDVTWRLHPRVCEYVSEVFYENRLQPKQQNRNRTLEGNTPYSLSGLYLQSVSHVGNDNFSSEEVAVVSRIIDGLLNNGVNYVDHNKIRSKLTPERIKVITPYNAQMNALAQMLPHITTGTVDKFQGQEAAVIIFSMATSTPEDAPRGMEFLYSLNRLNVAVSRAKAVFILVASPALFEPNCRSPRQMKLANALCRLVEKAYAAS